MTIREMYKAISTIDTLSAAQIEELKAAAADQLVKMESADATRRAKAAEKAAEKQAAKAPIRDALLAVMGDAENPMTATMLIEAAGLADSVKPASVPSLMKPLVESGIVLKVDVKVTGKGTQRGYVRA